MGERDRAAIEAIKGIYAAGAVPMSATSLVRHDSLTGRTYIHLSHVMEAALAQLGYDVEAWKAEHEASLRAVGKWPDDILPAGVIEGEYTVAGNTHDPL